MKARKKSRLIVVDETVSYSEHWPDVLVVPFNLFNVPEIPRAELYQFLEKARKIPTTGSMSSRKLYEIIKDKHKSKKEVLFIAIPKELSKITEAFEETAEMLRKDDINSKVFICGQAFVSLYFFVTEALGSQGDLDHTIRILEEKKQDIFLYGVPNLKYLARIGRISGAKSMGSRVIDSLGFLPIFSVRDDVIQNVKINTKKNVVKNLMSAIEERIGYKETYKVHLCYGKEDAITKELKESLDKKSITYIESRTSKAVAINAGPRTIGFAFQRQGYKAIDGEILINVLELFYDKIKRQRNLLNILNLFPVIDSDTGNNLERTLKPLKNLQQKGIKRLLQDLNEFTTENASGYSGTCMNAFFYGLYTGYMRTDKNDEVTKEDLITMLQEAKRQAYLSFKKVKPVEGTILTAIRKTAEAFQESEATHIERILIEAYRMCVDELIRPAARPEILRKKNVVDSGALGFSKFLEAFVEVLGRSKEIEETKTRLMNTITTQRMYFYYRPKEARTRGFCLVYKVDTGELSKIIEEITVSEISISHKKDYSLVHLHLLPIEKGEITALMQDYELISDTPLSQPWYLLLKNQFLMLGEKIRLTPAFIAWSFYWLGLRMVWPFREMRLAREYKKYTIIVKGLEKLIDQDYAILAKGKSYQKGFGEDELTGIKSNVKDKDNESSEYFLKIGNKSYKIEVLRLKEKPVGRLVTRVKQITLKRD